MTKEEIESEIEQYLYGNVSLEHVALEISNEFQKQTKELQKEVEELKELATEFKVGVYSLGMQHGKSFSDVMLKYRQLLKH